MATHSSVLAWRIPGMGKPGVLQSIGSQRLGHNLATKKQQFDQNEFALQFTGSFSYRNMKKKLNK